MFHSNLLMAGFDPLTLFASSEPGGWYDPSDFSTMFKDTAGTDPVTGAGDAVARINDKSGNGNNLTQSTSTARPLLQKDAGGRWYLDFDGADDELRSSSFAAGTDKAQIFLGVLATSTNNKGVAEFGTLNSTVGGFNVLLANGSPPSGGVRSLVCSNSTITAMLTTQLVVDTRNVITQLYNIAGATADAESQVRLNGTLPTQTAAAPGDAGSGNFETLSFGLGIANTLYLPGRIYSAILRFGTALTTQQITDAETWVNGKTGAY